MIIESKRIESKSIIYTIRSPRKEDANELSKLRIKIDGETENLLIWADNNGIKKISQLFNFFVHRIFNYMIDHQNQKV